MQNPKNVSAITLRSGKQIEVPPPVAASAPEPVKLHSKPEKEDEIVAQKRKLPDQGAKKNFHPGRPSSNSFHLQQPFPILISCSVLVIPTCTHYYILFSVSLHVVKYMIRFCGIQTRDLSVSF